MDLTSTFAIGLLRNMPADSYHAVQAMSASGLKLMRQSPAHYYGLHLDPNRPRSDDPTPAMQNGTLVHCALFEPDALNDRYVVKPADCDARTKAGKEWMAAQQRIVISADQMAAAMAQADAVRKLPDVAALLETGEPEQSAFWVDEQVGELCKCRPDWTHTTESGVILIDGKTCRDASADGFGRQIWNFDYHLQAAWYSDGYERATGQRVLGFVFAAVESTWPHQAAAYMLGDDVLDKARGINRALLEHYAACKRSNRWPGYASGIRLINLPKWANLEIAE